MPTPEGAHFPPVEHPQDPLVVRPLPIPDMLVDHSQRVKDLTTQHLVASGHITRTQDSRLMSTNTGDWYLPLAERIGTHREEYLAYLKDGPEVWSAAVGLHSPDYDDGEVVLKRMVGKNTGAFGHAWLSLVGPDGQKVATEANLAPGKTLDAIRADMRPNLSAYQRILNRRRQLFAVEDRIIDGRDNNKRYPHSIVELFITPQQAETLRLDIATHEWTAGKSSDFKSARFNGINLRGQNCIGYITDLLDGVGIDLSSLLDLENVSLPNGPVLVPYVHRAGYRLARNHMGVVLPERDGRPGTTVYPVNFNDSTRGNIYLLDVGERYRAKGTVSDVLEDARAHGIVSINEETGSLTSALPDTLEQPEEMDPLSSETLELPQEAIAHVADHLGRDANELQVTQKYSGGSNGSTFQLGEDIVLKIYEPSFSSKTARDFYRSIAIQRILHSRAPDLVPRVYTQDTSVATVNDVLTGVGKPFVVMDKVSGIIPEKPTEEDAINLGKALAQFHMMSDELIAALGEDAFESMPKLARRVDAEMLGLVMRSAISSAHTYTSRGVLLGAMMSAPFLHRKIQRSHLPKGILHMDFHWPNCLLDGDKSTIIDFDSCTRGTFIEDIGNTMVLLLTSLNTGPFDHRLALAQSFLEGYTGVRQISANEFGALPLAFQEQVGRWVLRNNRYADRADHWSARVMPEGQFDYARQALIDNLDVIQTMVAEVAKKYYGNNS